MQKFEDVAVDSPQYTVTPRSILLAASCAELSHQIVLCDFMQYDTARNCTPRSIILRRTLEKYEYLGKNKSKNETILTHRSVAQTGSNDEQNWG